MTSHDGRGRETEVRTGRLGVLIEHLMPSGRLPGAEESETVWTGCDGPAPGSPTDRRARFIGAGSWLLVLVLAVWLHLTQMDGFIEAFPLVVGVKILVFLWVLFGVSLLRPLFISRSRRSKPESTRAG